MLSAIMLFNPITAMIGFVVFAACIAVIIILGKWILSLVPGVPQPLIVCLGIIVFIFLFLLFLQWVGIYSAFGQVNLR
jgi:hypothetical protein